MGIFEALVGCEPPTHEDLEMPGDQELSKGKESIEERHGSSGYWVLDAGFLGKMVHSARKSTAHGS